jgi:hypothetical protein
MEQIRRVMRPTDVSFSPSPVSPPPPSLVDVVLLAAKRKVAVWRWVRSAEGQHR